VAQSLSTAVVRYWLLPGRSTRLSPNPLVTDTLLRQEVRPGSLAQTVYTVLAKRRKGRPMPKFKNRLPSYRLYKRSGQAVVTLNGRDIYLGVHNTEESRENYKRAIKEWV
jgi:hypothetical protein